MPGQRPTPTCLFCGGEECVSIFDLYPSGEFQVETCCLGLHEALQDQTPQDWRDLLVSLGIEELTGHRLRRVLDSEPSFLLDHQLDIRSEDLATARAFVAAHHAHCPAPAGWKFGASVWNGTRKVGIVMVGRPVARLIDHTTTLEVNRLCLRRDLPDGLRWNAASMLYGWAARQARRLGFKRLITYTLEEESGVSLKAAGFTPEARTAGGSWTRPSRQRMDRHPTGPKVRWARELTK